MTVTHLKEVCNMIVTCGDIECKYYNPNGCTADEVDHSADRFCITGRRKQQEDYTDLMRAGNPNCHKYGGKWVNNKGRVLR